MVFGKIKKFLSDEEETTYVATKKGDFIELSPEMGRDATANIMFKYYILKDFSDIKSIISGLREGHTIALMKINQLKTKDISELRRAIAKIKKTCEAMGGSLIGVDENWVVATPSYVKVDKGEILPDNASGMDD
ncbi:MAG: cell division protein SepF [Candidatus Nanoarchaeia archaeon]|nr:cell division protein SepF [Candidatus Nanoarchaeia archaeon]